MTDVSKVYPGGSVALQNVDIHIEPGEFVFVVGPSGAGKSTFIKMLFREVLPTTGSIFVNGVDILSLTPNEIPYMRRQLGIIFQDYRLLPDRTVYENVAFAMEVIETPRRKIKRRVLNVLDLVGLRHRADAYPNELSGGEQQRIAIARAIVNEPKVLLLDEPLGALDLKLRQSMQYELIRFKNELGITFVYVTHDQEEALTMSDTIVVMNQGYIQQIGTPEDIYNEPENAFVADFIGHSNIIDGVMIKDKLVEILGVKMPCVDEGFGENTPVDIVIRPEDVELVPAEDGYMQGDVVSNIFKGVHYELEVKANGYDWMVHTTKYVEIGSHVGIKVIPFNIQVMHKPESSDEKAVEIDV